jgi:hypothetical protein
MYNLAKTMDEIETGEKERGGKDTNKLNLPKQNEWYESWET